MTNDNYISNLIGEIDFSIHFWGVIVILSNFEGVECNLPPFFFSLGSGSLLSNIFFKKKKKKKRKKALVFDVSPRPIS